MYRKKLTYLALAALLPFGSVVMAEETATEAAAAPAAEAAAPAEAAPAPAEAAPAASEAAEAPAVSEADAAQERMNNERDARYAELKERAAKNGVILPDTPPWRDRGNWGAHDQEMMEKRREHMKMMQAMSPEDRDAYRMQRYQEMRERATELGIDMPENPPWKERQQAMADAWAKHSEVIKGMTDEERDACHAMMRKEMIESAPGPMGRGMLGRPFDGPGYGYGPGPYGPGPWGNDFWAPDQQ